MTRNFFFFFKKKGGLALNKAILTLRIFVFTSKIFEQVFGHPKGFFTVAPFDTNSKGNKR